jgi:hypothetical protein
MGNLTHTGYMQRWSIKFQSTQTILMLATVNTLQITTSITVVVTVVTVALVIIIIT